MLDFPLLLDRSAPDSLQRQLLAQLRRAILDGRLAPGMRLPSSRQLAQEARISRNVVLAAYDELYAEGYVAGRHGSGTYVTGDLPTTPRPSLPNPSGMPRWLHRLPMPPIGESVQSSTVAFRLGRPEVSELPHDTWRRIWNAVANETPPADYGPPDGDPDLRAAIAGYLRRSRGVACGADDVLITGGAVQAIDLIARATLGPHDTVAFEEPGYPVSRQVLQGRGVQLLPIPVDNDGLQVDALPRSGNVPMFVYVTPSHQYPLGARMPVGRRLALLDWARETDSLIVEDDYDSEFRFDSPPLPALAGLDDVGCVAYIGTFSKVLMPSLRVGYLVAPPPLRERIARLKRLSDYHTPWPTQRAMTTFIVEGHLERHIRRMRRHYGEKRAALHAALAPVSDRAQLRGLDAGLHAFVELDAALDAEDIARRAARRGVDISTLSGYWIGEPTCHGLLLGYGGLSLADIEQGAAVIADLIRES